MSKVVSILDFEKKRAEKLASTQTESKNYEAISRIIDAGLIGVLSPGAFVVLRLILSMTIAKNRNKNAIKYTEIQHGIVVQDVFVQSGTGMSQVSINKHVEELRKAGIVQVTKVKKSTKYPYSVYEIDFKNLEAVVNERVKKSLSHYRKCSGESTTENVVSLYNNNVLTKVNRRDSRARGSDTIAEAISSTKKKTDERRAARAAKTRTRKAALTMAVVKAAWEESVLKHYDSVPPVAFTAKEFAIFKNKVKAITAAGTLNDFFDWVCASWQDMRSTKFDWLRSQGRDIAKAPSLYELMHYWKIFVMQYAEHKVNDELHQRKTSVSESDKQAAELARLRQQVGKLSQEKSRLADRLKVAEQVAYSAPVKVRRQRRTEENLTQRIVRNKDAFDAALGDDIPEWGSDD